MCVCCRTTWLQVAGAELLSRAVDSDRAAGSSPVAAATRHRALGPRAPRLLHTWDTHTHTQLDDTLIGALMFSNAERGLERTKAGLDAAAVDPDSFSLAGSTPERGRRVGS